MVLSAVATTVTSSATISDATPVSPSTHVDLEPLIGRLQWSVCALRPRPGGELTDDFPGLVVSSPVDAGERTRECEDPVVTEPALTRARAGDEDAFRALTDPYRRELHLHCYRILGSVQDAEDVLQETMLAAWRGLDGFEERASLRAWLYRIATNRCLNMLRDEARRPREAPGLPFEAPPPTRLAEPLWLEPYPDSLLPETRYETKEAVALAYVIALQRLAPRQRAVLVLRDVLGFRAAEVAGMLETTEVSVTSALQRARAALEERLPADRERAPLPRSARERELVGRFADAFEHDDVERVIELLTADASVTMPPEPEEYQGHAAIAAFLRDRVAGRAGRGVRLVPTRANGQPAFGHYLQDPHAPVARNMGLLVLTLEGDRIAAITRFHDGGVLPHFGLPRTLPW
jgi:RNA polymerase sigma-70 factor (ECF subfamily)